MRVSCGANASLNSERVWGILLGVSFCVASSSCTTAARSLARRIESGICRMTAGANLGVGSGETVDCGVGKCDVARGAGMLTAIRGGN